MEMDGRRLNDDKNLICNRGTQRGDGEKSGWSSRRVSPAYKSRAEPGKNRESGAQGTRPKRAVHRVSKDKQNWEAASLP